MAPPEIKTDLWLAGAKHRRTVYGLKGTSHVPDSRIEDIIKEVISFSPSSYNTQPGRITLVLGQKHKDLWDSIISTAEPILKAAGPGVWDHMGPTLQAFKNAYGSVSTLYTPSFSLSPRLAPCISPVFSLSGLVLNEGAISGPVLGSRPVDQRCPGTAQGRGSHV